MAHAMQEYYLVQLLDEHYTIGNHSIWDSIDNDDYKKFESILSNEKIYKNTFSIKLVIEYLVKINSNRQKYFKYIINNYDKYWWKITDWSIIIAYCAYKSDVTTLTNLVNLITTIDNNNKTSNKIISNQMSYNLFQTFQTIDFCKSSLHISHESICEFLDETPSEKEGKRRKKEKKRRRRRRGGHNHDNQESETEIDQFVNEMKGFYSQRIANMMNEKSILDLCIESKIAKFCDDDDNKNNSSSNSKISKLNNKLNDNYRCFEYLLTKLPEICLTFDSNETNNEIIRKCFKNYKNSFIECLITNGLFDDYTCVIEDITSHPAMWKVGSLKVLVNNYTVKERYYHFGSVNAYIADENHFKNIEVNSLQSWVNIGLEPIDIDTKYGYSKDNYLAAFECFKLVLESATREKNELNKLINQRMKDCVHIIEVCVSNSIKHPQFINYLVSNNGKFNWFIDYRNTNVLQLASLVGNYKIFEKINNQLLEEQRKKMQEDEEEDKKEKDKKKKIEEQKSNTDNEANPNMTVVYDSFTGRLKRVPLLKASKKEEKGNLTIGYEPPGNELPRGGLRVINSKRWQWINAHFIRDLNNDAGDEDNNNNNNNKDNGRDRGRNRGRNNNNGDRSTPSVQLNNFVSLNYYKSKENSTYANNPRYTNTYNLFYWCINVPMTVVLNLEIERKSGRLIDDYNSAVQISSDEYIYVLNAKKRRLLCLGYLRSNGIEYPDNLAMVLDIYFDWRYGSRQCFEYLFETYCNKGNINYEYNRNCIDTQQIELYPHIIEDCVKYDRPDLLNSLAKKYKDSKYILNTTTIVYFDHESRFGIYIQCKDAFILACCTNNSAVISALLSILNVIPIDNGDNENDIDGNENNSNDNKSYYYYNGTYYYNYGNNNNSDNNNNNNNNSRSKRRRVSDSDKFDINGSSVVPQSSRMITPLMAIIKGTIEQANNIKKNNHFRWYSSMYENKHEAFINESIKCLEILVSQPNIDVNREYFDKTPFLHAVCENKVRLVEYLILMNNKYNLNINFCQTTNADLSLPFSQLEKNNFHKTCFDIAVENGYFQMLKLLFNNVENMNLTNDDMCRMCNVLLFSCVFRASGNVKNYHDIYQMFVFLLGVRDKKTWVRYIYPTKVVITTCMKYNLTDCLTYLVDECNTDKVVVQEKHAIDQYLWQQQRFNELQLNPDTYIQFN